LDKELLAVGDSTRLEIIFSTKTYKGRIIKKPRIQTNEGPPDKSVQIISQVVARPDSTYPLILQPYKLDMSQFTDKVIDEAKFTIRNVSDKELTLSTVAMPGSIMSFDLPKSVKPGESVEATVKLNKAGIDTSFTKSITISVNDADSSRFTIPVKRTIKNMGDQHTAARGR